MKLVYMGFSHETTGVRLYSFEGVVSQGIRKAFLVSADVSLLTKHHIQIQEGPILLLCCITQDVANLLFHAASVTLGAAPQTCFYVIVEPANNQLRHRIALNVGEADIMISDLNRHGGSA